MQRLAPFLRRTTLLRDDIGEPEAYPFSLPVAYEDTEHVRLTRDFLADPKRFVDQSLS